LPPDYTQVVKGRDHTCGLRANGLVRCWGDNMFGQLGTGAMGLVAAPAH
jgi:alpha-tubulin suppressor-like RCC1 family protein